MLTLFKMRPGSTEFPAHYSGWEIPLAIPQMHDTAEENWAEILRFCAGANDDERSKAALATFSGAFKLGAQKAVKAAAGEAGSDYLLRTSLQSVGDEYLATAASRDYGTVKRTAPGNTVLKAERDAAREVAENALGALVRLSTTLKGAAKAAVDAEIATMRGDTENTEN